MPEVCLNHRLIVIFLIYCFVKNIFATFYFHFFHLLSVKCYAPQKNKMGVLGALNVL
jgi:hypothetical protein